MTGLHLDPIGEWSRTRVSDIICSELNRIHNLTTDEIEGLEFEISYEFDGDTAKVRVFHAEYLSNNLVIQLPITY